MKITTGYFRLTVLPIVLLICQFGYGQTPFDILVKADSLVENGKFKKALRKIDYSESIKYCTCGQCALQLNKEANLLRYKVYSKTKQYELSRQSLDSIHLSDSQVDSLKILTYQLEYGKEFLSEIIDSALSKSKLICNDYDCYVDIPLGDLKKSIRFRLDLISSFTYSIDKDSDTGIEKWRKDFMKSSAYKMLKGSS